MSALWHSLSKELLESDIGEEFLLRSDHDGLLSVILSVQRGWWRVTIHLIRGWCACLRLDACVRHSVRVS